MLVLSRRPQQKVLFPNLGVRVGILSVQGQVVRVGVDAPRDVPVWREEIAPADCFHASSLQHLLRNRLNEAGLALQLAQQQIRVGQCDAAETTLHRAFAKLGRVDEF